MANSKKYSAFSGVFTPSILTILGVIMYMRLGWVVGEAGLIGTLGIIAIAHIISITTGLSISSIATDKEIKNGGIYYILSRSLGLPMGGAIGIALFIGTALSISLYIVGFSESFLALDAIQNFTGLMPDINGLRIVGTVIMVILVVVAFISTSLAMKIQFFILIAIGLSLISVALGFLQNASPAAIAIPTVANGQFPLEYVFAIFFPAVTGFTAGVAMSGDLSNPKKAIPRGTILSIGLGFVIYVALAISIAIFIPREDLLNNYNILVDTAWSSELVIAGIWGATLSSALGGILGGPRILQAVAKDKMSPKIFGKGYGESNEPRNALLLIFAIAECGILIGELDVIAGVVSMFYLASYGFINLSYVLEKWASSDFRPTFNIHISFGIIGFIASFAVMFKLDMVSMFASLLIMGILYFILKRREIRSESGDVWQSVWASVVRRSLSKLEDKQMEERNWKPNIILFNGANKHPHLLQFGKSIIGKYGFITNFELIEDPDTKLLFSKNQQSIKGRNPEEGIFTRRQSVRNIYEGIEMIAQTYGFSGIEPNTILMGWGRQTQNPKRLVQMLDTLTSLDYNVLMIDYDKLKGFGKKKHIDIWWHDLGKHGNLALTLAQFLSNSAEWNLAKVRIMIVNSKNSKMELIRNKAESFLENMRIDAELKIINNEIEKKPFNEIIVAESQNTDLIFLGIPDLTNENAEEFVHNTKLVMKSTCSIVLVKPCSVFKHLHLGLNEIPKQYKPIKLDTSKTLSFSKIEVKYPHNILITNHLKTYSEITRRSYQNHLVPCYKNISESYSEQIQTIEQHFTRTIDNLHTRFEGISKIEQKVLIQNQKILFLQKLSKQIESYINKQLPELALLLDKQYIEVLLEQTKAFDKLPTAIKIFYNKSDMEIKPTDNSAQKRYKWWRKSFPNQKFTYRLRLKTLIQEKYYNNINSLWINHFEEFGMLHVQFAVEILELAKVVNKQFTVLMDLASKEELKLEHINKENLKIQDCFEKLKTLNANIFSKLNKVLDTGHSAEINKLTHIFNQVHPNGLIDDLPKDKTQRKKEIQKLQAVPMAWKNNQRIVLNAVNIEIGLMSLQTKIKRTIGHFSQEYRSIVSQPRKFVENVLQTSEPKDIHFDDIDVSDINFKINKLVKKTNDLLNKLAINFPDKIEVFESDTFNHFEHQQFEELPSLQLSISQSIDVLIKNKIEAPLINSSTDNTQKINQLFNHINDSKHLISFVQENNDTESSNLIEDNTKEIEKRLIKAKEHEVSLIMELESITNEMDQQLNYQTFIKTVSKLRQYIIKQRRNGKMEGASKLIEQGIQTVKNWRIDLIYARSQAITFKNKYQTTSQLSNPVNKLLDFTEQISPSKAITDSLPFFYKQLFTSQDILHKDFWVGREDELKKAQKGIRRYHEGYKGALAIVGENGLGKSFFAEQLINLEQVENHIKITSTNYSDNSLATLKRIINEVTDYQNKPIEYIFERMPLNTWIIIEDIEFWWHIGKPDQEVINYLFKLIRKYSARLLFIMVSNKSVFDDISQTPSHLEYFISIIQLNRVNAKTLSHIILNRHKASGYKLRLNGKQFKDKNDTIVATFFNKIHNITHGNIEAALQMWVNSISELKNETLFLSTKDLSTDNLEVLDIDSCIILKLLLKYKKVKLNSLSQDLDETNDVIKNKMDFLIRTGLVVSINHQYVLNKYCKFQVWNFLHLKGMI